MGEELFPSRLKQLRTEKGFSLAELASKVGTTKVALSRYENGERSPQIGIVGKLANEFNVDMAWLSGTTEEKKSTSEILIAVYNKLDTIRKEKILNQARELLEEQQNEYINLDAYQEIKVLSKVSAGTGILDLDPFSYELVQIYGKTPENYDMAFEVSGDSMEPLFQDGEIIYVKETNDISNGQISVIQINEEAFLKKVYVEDNDVKLVSLNKSYKDLIATEKDNIKVVGKVVF